MTNGKKILWAIIILIGLFLIYQVLKRIRIGKKISTLINTNSSTSIDTGTGHPIDSNTEERLTGCTTPLVNQGRVYCVKGKRLTNKNGVPMCC